MGTRLVDVAKFSSLPAKRGMRVVVEGESLVLWKVGGGVVAAENLCPHQHLDTLHLGPVEHGEVTCPMHGWSFDLDTGMAITGSGRLKPYPVRVEKDRVLVELHDGS